MIDLTGIEKFETRGKTVHSHYDGREIQRIFHVLGDIIPGQKPSPCPARYQKAPDVVEAMLGSVTQEVEGGNWTRHFPAQDPEYPQCYCNEVKVGQIDPRAIASSPTLALRNLAVELTPEARYAKFMQQVNSVQDNPAGGSFLTASYRPLISGYKPEYSRHELEGRIFDWIDPHFTPAVRTVPWPDGMEVVVQEKTSLPGKPGTWGAGVPEEVGQPVNVAVLEFTVKRLLLGEVNHSLLDPLLNTVNDSSWPIIPVRYNIPQFPKGTLRFDSYDVVNHFSPSSPGGFWYELVYHFLWMNLKDKPVFGEEGQRSGIDGWGDVTWNHVLMRPDAWLRAKGDLGWYFVAKIKGPEWSPTEGHTLVGPIYAFADFDPLFMLNPPH